MQSNAIDGWFKRRVTSVTGRATVTAGIVIVGMKAGGKLNAKKAENHEEYGKRP